MFGTIFNASDVIFPLNWIYFFDHFFVVYFRIFSLIDVNNNIAAFLNLRNVSIFFSLKLFCGANVVLAMYLSLVHQTGPNAALDYLSSNCKNSTGILILTPCHGTPFYSHLHWKVPMKFLQCPPDLGNNPKDENKKFVENPLKVR